MLRPEALACQAYMYIRHGKQQTLITQELNRTLDLINDVINFRIDISRKLLDYLNRTHHLVINY